MRKNNRILLLILCLTLVFSLGGVQTVFAATETGGSSAAAETAISAPSSVKALSSGKTTIKVSWKKVVGAREISGLSLLQQDQELEAGKDDYSNIC